MATLYLHQISTKKRAVSRDLSGGQGSSRCDDRCPVYFIQFFCAIWKYNNIKLMHFMTKHTSFTSNMSRNWQMIIYTKVPINITTRHKYCAKDSVIHKNGQCWLGNKIIKLANIQYIQYIPNQRKSNYPPGTCSVTSITTQILKNICLNMPEKLLPVCKLILIGCRYFIAIWAFIQEYNSN